MAHWIGVLQVDLRNAFNMVDRQSALQGAASFSPAMYPWLRFLYESPALLVCQGEILWSRTGVHQGCPLGPAAFAVGMYSAILQLKALPLMWNVFYLDDGLLVCPLPVLREAFRQLCTTMR